MLPLRRAVLCLAATAAALAACQTPSSAPAASGSSDAAPTVQAQQQQPQQEAPHAASTPDAGRPATAAVRPRPSTQPKVVPMPSDAPSPSSGEPPATATGSSQPFLLKDTGVRCVTFPCPSYSVQAPGAKGRPREVHELDLSALGSDAERERVQEGVQLGVRVEGTLSVRESAGPAGSATVLRVTRVLK